MAAVTATVSAGLLTVAGSALTASTVYTVVLNVTGSASATHFKVTTDGSGVFSQVIPAPQNLQGATFNVKAYANNPAAADPVTNLNQTISSLTAAASTTFVVPTPNS